MPPKAACADKKVAATVAARNDMTIQSYLLSAGWTLARKVRLVAHKPLLGQFYGPLGPIEPEFLSNAFKASEKPTSRYHDLILFISML